MHVCVCMYMYICMYICMYIYMFRAIREFAQSADQVLQTEHIHVYVYVYMHVYVYVYTRMYV